MASSSKTNFALFTLKILTEDVHIMDSPNLIITVQENPEVFDFNMFVHMILPTLTATP